jgi:hypothetical protein
MLIRPVINTAIPSGSAGESERARRRLEYQGKPPDFPLDAA